jgi:dolichol-phosphate mannosyltransferase
MGKLLSVVLPCYNEQDVIAETYRQLAEELQRLSSAYNITYELIFVNDGSQDRTLELLYSIHANHKAQYGASGQVIIVSLARNFGHQMALSAGLETARGDAVVAIDADLQDPPAVIEDMYKKYLDGVDVAYGVRLTRGGDSFFKRLSTRIFYRGLRLMTQVDIPLDTGDFRLVSRRALNVLNKMPERHRFIRGMIPWMGFRQEPVPYHRHARHAGESKYPFMSLLRLAIEGVTSFSYMPLRLAWMMGCAVALLCAAYALFIILAKITAGVEVEGWSSLMVAILFFGAVQLLSVGLLGEYLGRIYDEVKQRPLFVIDEAASRLITEQSTENKTES